MDTLFSTRLKSEVKKKYVDLKKILRKGENVKPLIMTIVEVTGGGLELGARASKLLAGSCALRRSP